MVLGCSLFAATQILKESTLKMWAHGLTARRVPRKNEPYQNTPTMWPLSALTHTLAHMRKGLKSTGQEVSPSCPVFLCLFCLYITCSIKLPIICFFTPSAVSSHESGRGRQPAKKRLAAACGKPNALLAPPEGG